MRNDVPNIMASAAVTFPLATLALSLRLVSRSITTAGYGYDDIFAVVGWVSRPLCACGDIPNNFVSLVGLGGVHDGRSGL